MHGTTHLYSGQEACSVGVCSVLGRGDRVAATYRGHGAALAMGVEPEALMAELLGRSTGVCGGRAGSMNVVDLAHGLIGCFGIIGGSIAAATGQALANQIRESDDVAVAFFGDGATNQAYFPECLNFASIQPAPARVRLREQPLRRVHADRGRHGRHDRRAARRPRHPHRGRRRQRRVGGPGWRRGVRAPTPVPKGPCSSSCGRTASSATRAAIRPPTASPESSTVEVSATRCTSPAGGSSEEHGVADATLDEVDTTVEQELERLIAAALAAPWPDPAAPVSEFAGAGR